MAIVLAFLLGMPLVAVPQILEQLQGLLLAKPRELVAYPQLPAPSPDQAADERDSAERSTTVTTLAPDHPPLSSSPPTPGDSATTIEALKAQFVEAGASYMVLERIGAHSTKYRFRFQIPVTAGSAYRKQFQVVNDAPDAAMRQALMELQKWRAADREPAYLGRPNVILR